MANIVGASNQASTFGFGYIPRNILNLQLLVVTTGGPRLTDLVSLSAYISWYGTQLGQAAGTGGNGN